MTGRDTDPQPFSEPTPTRLSEVVRKEAKKGIKKLAPAFVTLLMAALLFWTTRINVAAEEAKDAAEDAQAKGEKGERAAKVAKVEARATYEVATDKDLSIVADLKRVTERLNVVEAELELLRGRARTRRRKPIVLSPATTAPPPPSPAAAVEQAASPPQ